MFELRGLLRQQGTWRGLGAYLTQEDADKACDDAKLDPKWVELMIVHPKYGAVYHWTAEQVTG